MCSYDKFLDYYKVPVAKDLFALLWFNPSQPSPTKLLTQVPQHRGRGENFKGESEKTHGLRV